MNRLLVAAAAVVLIAAVCPAAAGEMPYTFTDDCRLLTATGWDVTITYLEPYLLEGVVVGVMRYADPDLPYSPVDVAVAWGLLADPGNGTLACTMGDRQLSYVWTSHNASIDGQYVTTHVSNNHIIPRYSPVYDAVVGLSEGDVIVMRGYLVELDGTRREGTTVYTSHWGPSSLVRDDEGPGACEIFLVHSIAVNGIAVSDSAPEADISGTDSSVTVPEPAPLAEAKAGAPWERLVTGAPATTRGGVLPMGVALRAVSTRPQSLLIMVPALAVGPLLLIAAVRRSRR